MFFWIYFWFFLNSAEAIDFSRLKLNGRSHTKFLRVINKFIELVDILLLNNLLDNGISIDTTHLFLVEITGALAPTLSIGVPFKSDLKERSSDTVYTENAVKKPQKRIAQTS